MCDCLSVSEVFGAVISPLTSQENLVLQALEMFIFSPLFLVQSGVVFSFWRVSSGTLRVGVQASFLSAFFFTKEVTVKSVRWRTENVKTPLDPGGVFAHPLNFQPSSQFSGSLHTWARGFKFTFPVSWFYSIKYSGNFKVRRTIEIISFITSSSFEGSSNPFRI